MNDNLFEALYTLYSTSNTFKTATSGRLDYGKANDRWKDNFAIIQAISAEQDDYFAQEIDNVSFQINVFSTLRATCWDLLDKCKQLFDGKYLTVSGASAPIRISRESQIPPVWNEQDNLYQATITFEAMIY